MSRLSLKLWIFCAATTISLGGCSAEVAALCDAARCREQGKNCGGMVVQGCGVVQCGQCLAGETCGGGGTPNVCGVGSCTPTTCQAYNVNCGMISDGCAGVLDCGQCTTVPTAEKPLFLPPSTEHVGPLDVIIVTTTTGAVIHYEMGVSPEEPTENSVVYTGPLTISATTTIVARAFKAEMSPSATARASYVITTTDTTLPEVVITSPTNGSTVATSTVTVSGTASDDVLLAKVELKVGAGSYGLASGTTSWTKQVALSAGSNTVNARATDTSGNSAEVLINVTYIEAAQCGNGAIDTGEACDTNGNLACSAPMPICRYDCDACVPASIVINPDKTISINEKKTFPVTMFFICSATHDSLNGYESCDASLIKNGNFTATHLTLADPNESYWNTTIPKLEKANIYWDTKTSTADVDFFRNQWRDSPNFLGYYMWPEEQSTVDGFNQLKIYYDTTKVLDPNHPVLAAGNYFSAGMGPNNLASVSDIIMFDAFFHSTSAYWDLDDFIFVAEQNTNSYLLHYGGDFASIDQISKPVWLILDAWGVDWDDAQWHWKVLTKQKIRAHAYWAITTNVKGITYMGNKFYGNGIETYGVIRNDTINAWYNDLAGELTSQEMQNVLLLPSLNYSWDATVPWDNKVTFSSNPTKHVIYLDRPSLSYSYKYDTTTNKHYLIIANKNNCPVTTSITISGLSGSMTAVTLGTEAEGTSRFGRRIDITNGIFSDIFDGYAAHVYEIE